MYRENHSLRIELDELPQGTEGVSPSKEAEVPERWNPVGFDTLFAIIIGTWVLILLGLGLVSSL